MPPPPPRTTGLADLLEARQAELLQRWTEEVKRRFAPGPLSRAELENHIPEFLRELVEGLRHYEETGESGLPTGNVLAVAKEHGKQRFRVGFDLDAVTREYGALSDLLLELAAEVGPPFPLEEWKVITQRFTHSVAEAVRQYSREREEERSVHQRLQELLLGIVGHDIRSPLSTIMASASYLQDRGDLLPAQVKPVQRIVSSTERIEGLVSTLLDYTRARLGRGLPVTPSPVCLHEIGGKVLDEMQVAHPDRKLRCDALGDTCGAWDPARLMQLIQNLLDNALKYSPRESPVTLKYRASNGDVVLTVHNEGPPIAPELLPHLFEPFRQGTQTSAPAKGSMGLGLYIVREIVTAHGGSIEVRSTEAEGTSFIVKLPRQPSGNAAPPGQ